MLKKPNLYTLKEFILPFRKTNYELFIILQVILLLIGILSIVVHLLSCCPWKQELSFFNISSLLLCLLSIYLTSRVYFEIKKEKTDTLDDYLERLTDIIAKSKAKDRILIIAPTIILGQVNKDESILKNMYLEDIYRLLANKGEICFALLDWDITNINEFNITCRTIGEITNFDYETQGSIKKDLFDYHIKNWGLYINTISDIKKAMNESLLKNLKTLKDNDNSSFIRLKKDMFCVKDGNSSGFFAVVNFTRGIYYMGNFSVSGRTQKFQGTYFENEHIEEQMRHMLKCAVEEYCIDDDKKKLTEIFEQK